MKRITPLSVFCCLGLLFAASTCFAQSGSSITVFDVPGAISTNPVSINNSGDVAGWYCDATVCDDAWVQNPTHFRRGFVREANGNITTFDGIPTGINDAGVVVGYYFDLSDDTSGFHCCFVRDRQGNTSVFGVPVVNPLQRFHWGISVAISNRGEIAGYIIPGLAAGYIDEITYGFVRTPQGLLTTFVLPISAYPTSINARGDVTGTDLPPWRGGNVFKGFVRDRSGDITSFVAPGGDDSGGGCYGPLAVPVSINNRGDIAGHFYSHYPPCRWRSFVRKADGSFTVFDATQDTASNSSVIAVNAQGDVLGRTAGPSYQMAEQYFLRDHQGGITLIDIPSSPLITSAVPNVSGAINDRGDVTGTFNNQAFIRVH